MAEIVSFGSMKYKISMEKRIFDYISFINRNKTITLMKMRLGIFHDSYIFKKFFKISDLLLDDTVILTGTLRKRFNINDFIDDFNRVYLNKYKITIEGNNILIERKENLLSEIINEDKIYLITTNDISSKHSELIREYFKITSLIEGSTVFEIETRFILLECDKIKEIDEKFKKKLKLEKYFDHKNIFFLKEN